MTRDNPYQGVRRIGTEAGNMTKSGAREDTCEVLVSAQTRKVGVGLLLSAQRRFKQMQCDCGGMVSESKSVDNSKGLELTFQKCSACGRCDMWRLWETTDGRYLIATGIQAQERYNQPSINEH